ncbi:hypothetical protein MIND_01186700 [Mycena indigotica]|uniref:Uncharacterized protein n=1 Tax=Mycena indigotica TaxID=2126181 RepID=A0A8H6VSZ9_9AGAR|nr:uncharacterized protein MIND_01186700 [Mycena indigotica]KAF7292877.1 hypothetical protein MIND_01186700 [Mycena indigotica]
MAAADDLPWPELGNVSRGATRGNQGQKGVLGPPDREGRCVLQLRVQPGVLAVRLNAQASDWYRTLDNEVNRALKLTKTFWRKARRRQDYDARADQDHMELHEWLQQLKDKTMSHLELLMQKGDIQGPPYTMPDDIELTFLRKFIERQAAGVEHNPRLRNPGHSSSSHAQPPQPPPPPESYPMRPHSNSVDSPSPEPSERTYPPTSRNSGSPAVHSVDLQESTTAALHNCRATFLRAQKDSQEAFIRYTNCLEAERQARAALGAAEQRHEDYMAALMARNQAGGADAQSRHSSVSGDEPSPRYDDFRTADGMRSTLPASKQMDWPVDGSQGLYPTESSSHLDDQSKSRKHSRTWEHHNGLQDAHYNDGPYCHNGQDMAGLSGQPPRKRVHHMMPTFDVLSGAALQSNMLPS